MAPAANPKPAGKKGMNCCIYKRREEEEEEG